MSAPGLAARAAAAALLAGVLERKQSLADQISTTGGALARLDPAERARAQALATGALRHLGRIDAVLAGFLDKAPPPAARNALRLAVAEMRLDGVPAHAAVDGAVRLVRAHARTRHFAGLVNAVARRVAERGADLWDATPEGAPPEWIASALRSAYGAEAAAAIALAHLRPAPIDVTVKDPATAPRWAEQLGADVLPTGSLRIRRRAQVSGLPGFAAGAWWVQDAAAALAARLLGDVTGLRVLDICAAPGGKTLQLAAAGAEVTALDASAPRSRRLAENFTRTGLTVDVVVADALTWQPEAPFEAILVDAPCSATGTIRRHPDLPFVRMEPEVAALVDLQDALLDRAWDMLAPGGRLVYCTCSLLPVEGEERIVRFRATAPDADQRRPDPGAFGIAPAWLDARGGLRLRPDYWPELGGMDGFYAALLEKAAR